MELLSNEDEAYGCRVGKYNVILTNTACWIYNVYAYCNVGISVGTVMSVGK